MATFVFDTHRAVKDLAAAGFTEPQAEALVEIVGAAVRENVVTKGDLDAMEQRMTARFDAKFAAQKQDTDARFESLEQRTDSRFDALEQRMAAQFAAQKQDTDARFEAMEQRMEAQEQRQNARNDAMEHRLTIRFIAILLPSLGLFFAAMRFLS